MKRVRTDEEVITEAGMMVAAAYDEQMAHAPAHLSKKLSAYLAIFFAKLSESSPGDQVCSQAPLSPSSEGNGGYLD